MERFSRIANTLFILVLMGILSASYYQQFFKNGNPCPLCILQSFGMFGVALGLCLNLRVGIEPKHYGFSLLFALFGGGVSLRQIALHICPGFSVFGIPVFGLSLYTWAFLAFVISVFAIATLLMLYPKERGQVPKLNWFEWIAILAVLVLLTANHITTFRQCALGPCQDVPWPQPPAQTQASTLP